ncbi:MAG: hemolysin family protein [Pirellulales bacterium]
MLVLANGFFAAAEIAIIAARRGRLEQRADEGSRNAKLALELSRDPNRFLPTVQVGITLVSAFGAAYGGQQIVDDLSAAISKWPSAFAQKHAESIGLSIFVVCFTYVSLIIGELVPKRAALHRAEALAVFVAPVMSFLATVARPIVWMMGASSDAVLWLFRLRSGAEPTVSIDDIEHLIDAGTAEGVVEPLEQRMALEALRLGEHTVREIMRPRIDLDAMDVDTPPDEVLGTIAMAGFSRLPVYERDLDHIIGFVHIKDLLRQLHLGWPLELRKLLHPALFVPESMHLDRLLELFQEKHNQLAIVLNEYGGTEGMVTLEDVMEEIVGEIRDEHRRAEDQEFVQREDGTWLIDGGATMTALLDRLELEEDEILENRDFNTLGGLILERLGRIPSIGDEVDWNGMHLEVVDMDGKRIDRVLVKPQPTS